MSIEKFVSENILLISCSIAATALFASLVAFFVGGSIFAGLGIGIFLVAIVLALSRPQILLFALLLIRAAIDSTASLVTLSLGGSLAVTLAQALGIIVFVLGALIIIFHWERPVRTVLFVPLLLMIGWGLLTVPFAVTPGAIDAVFYESARIANIGFILFLAMRVTRTEKQFNELVWVCVLTAAVPLLFAFGQFLTQTGFTDASFGAPRIFGTFAHPNILATFLIAIVAASGILLLRKNFSNTQRMIAATIASASTVALLLTFTRVAWFALLVFLITAAFLRYRKWLILFLAVPLLLYALLTPVQQRVNVMFADSPDSSFLWRTTLWKDTIERTTGDGRALYGNGMNTFAVVAESTRGERGGSTDPHNEFVRAFVEGGLVGVAIYLFYTFLFLGLLFWWFLFGRDRTERTVFLILFSLFVALTIASLSDHIFRSSPLQWLVMALVGGAVGTFVKRK